MDTKPINRLSGPKPWHELTAKEREDLKTGKGVTGTKQ